MYQLRGATRIHPHASPSSRAPASAQARPVTYPGQSWCRVIRTWQYKPKHSGSPLRLCACAPTKRVGSQAQAVTHRCASRGDLAIGAIGAIGAR